MRVAVRWLVLLSVVAAAGLLGGAASGAGAPATPAQLALMPLPKSSLPAAARFLPLDNKSGVVSNKDAANEATVVVTAAALGRLGRITGYELDYSDTTFEALGKGKGLLGVETSVDLYRNARTARDGMAFWLKDETTFIRLKPEALTISFKPSKTPRIGQQRWSFAGSLTVRGEPPLYAVNIVFRVGAVIAAATVTSADPETGRAMIVPLARKLETRIRRVSSGKLKGAPVPLPGKPKAGPPTNGMDLVAMAIRPGDLGGGKISHQGYELDPDISPVSEFVRELTGSPFTAFTERIELFHSSAEAEFNISLLASRLIVNHKAKKPKPNDVAFAKTTEVKANAGDEARAMLVTVGFGDGTSINQGFVLVRVGSIVAFVSVGTPGNVTIPPAALAQLAQVAAARVATSLAKSGVA